MKDVSEWDVITVGGGPAGLSAVVQAARRPSTKILLCEQEDVLGGIPRHCDHAGFGIRDLKWNYSGPSYAKYLEGMVQSAKAEIRTETSVTNIETQNGVHTVHTVSPRGLQSFTSLTVVLATGCRESTRHNRLIPGGRPAGIFSTGSLQQFLHLKHITPGRRAVVLGSEHVSFSAVLTLHEAGIEVVAMVEQHEYPHSYRLVSWILERWIRFPLLLRHRIIDIKGERRVSGITVEDISTGAHKEIACDMLVISGDFLPEATLAINSAIALDPATKGPLVDPWMQTDRPGIFACGNVLHGAEAADIAALEGRWTGERVCSYLDNVSVPCRRIRIHCESPIAWVSPGTVIYPSISFPDFLYTMHVKERVKNAVVSATWDKKTFWQSSFGTLTPDRRIRIPVRKWRLPSLIDPTGSIHLSID